ncbi:MAG: hypothetical protein V4489_06235, partial [Chlamydiota bacterium]
MRIFAIGLCSLCFGSVCLGQTDERVDSVKAEKKPSSFPLGGDLSVGLDSFRSLPDGSWGGNMGAYLALNLALAIPPKTGKGNGIQGGCSFGVYDWDGRGSTESKSLQEEGFITLGLFHKTVDPSGVNVGLVYDWSINAKAGVFGLSPKMGQVRGQLGYL